MFSPHSPIPLWNSSEWHEYRAVYSCCGTCSFLSHMMPPALLPTAVSCSDSGFPSVRSKGDWNYSPPSHSSIPFPLGEGPQSWPGSPTASPGGVSGSHLGLLGSPMVQTSSDEQLRRGSGSLRGERAWLLGWTCVPCPVGFLHLLGNLYFIPRGPMAPTQQTHGHPVPLPLDFRPWLSLSPRVPGRPLAPPLVPSPEQRCRAELFPPTLTATPQLLLSLP